MRRENKKWTEPIVSGEKFDLPDKLMTSALKRARWPLYSIAGWGLLHMAQSGANGDIKAMVAGGVEVGVGIVTGRTLSNFAIEQEVQVESLIEERTAVNNIEQQEHVPVLVTSAEPAIVPLPVAT